MTLAARWPGSLRPTATRTICWFWGWLAAVFRWLGKSPRRCRPTGCVPGSQARGAAVVRAGDGGGGQRRRRRDERQRGVQPAHHRRAGARGDPQRDGRVAATRAGLPRRPPRRRPTRQDRDPGRRRHRNRCQHVGGGARRSGRRSASARGRSTGGAAVESAAARPGGRRRGVRDHAGRISMPSGRCTPISTRSATTRCANCWPSFYVWSSAAAFGGYRRFLGRVGAGFGRGLV